ncbi:hypothetical protein CPLU01_13038 [Colletotrichum plurivorum]|uniref:Uncharacterized protein n=1 Tax=Colletotrichum plurivorum TaxID=2175906 RepID=A0A8H6JVG0_9PEZI|nr:hypothetical protein CPLU01_13038 [Colletotrichum plurivorum]
MTPCTAPGYGSRNPPGEPRRDGRIEVGGGVSAPFRRRVAREWRTRCYGQGEVPYNLGIDDGLLLSQAKDE